MDLCSLEKLVTLQYESISTLGKWAKQVALRTGCLKWVTDWALRWQLYLDELGKDCPQWSIAWRQKWGLFLLEWLFHTAATMWRRELQCHMWRHLYSRQTAAAEDMAPEQLVVQTLLASRDEDILKIAEDISCGWYQLAPSILPCQHQDQLMSNLHKGLGQWLGRACLCGTPQMAEQCGQSVMCSNRTHSRGRTCSHTCSSSWVWMLSEICRQKGTVAPLQQRCSPTQANSSPSTNPTWNWEQLHASPRHEEQTPAGSPARHECSEAINIKWPQEASLRRCSWSTCKDWQQEQHWSPSQGGPVHSQASPRWPSRHVSLSPSCPQHRDKWVTQFFSQGTPEEGAHSHRGPMQRQVWFDLPNPEGLGEAPQPPTVWLPGMARGYYQPAKWYLEYPHNYKPSYVTWDDSAEEGGWPEAFYYWPKTQVQCHPFCWTYHYQWGQALTPHHAGLGQRAKGLCQDVCC